MNVSNALSFQVGDCWRLVFVNGHFAPELSSLKSLLPGVVVWNLAAGLGECPGLIEHHLGKYADYRNHPFTALNTAFIHDGAFINVREGTVATKLLHLLFVSTTVGEGAVAHPRNLIVVGASARATIVESHIGLDDHVHFTNGVTEIVVGEHAAVDHYKLLRDGDEAFHVATLQVHQAQDSKFTSHAVTLGGDSGPQ